VALNVDLVRLLEEALEVRFSVPDQPQLVGALGAAVIGLSGK